MSTSMLAGIRNRRSGLTYCDVTDTCCFYNITSSTQPTCIIVYVYYELSDKWFLYFLSIFQTHLFEICFVKKLLENQSDIRGSENLY